MLTFIHFKRKLEIATGLAYLNRQLGDRIPLLRCRKVLGFV